MRTKWAKSRQGAWPDDRVIKEAPCRDPLDHCDHISFRAAGVVQRPPRKAWFDTLPDVSRNLLYRIQAFATYVELIVRHREAVLTQRQLDHSNSLPHYCKAEHGHVISLYVRIIDRCIILMRVATGDGLHAVGQGTDHHG